LTPAEPISSLPLASVAPRVTAVIATQGRSLHLPQALVALAGQSVPPDSIVVVDAGPKADPAVAEMAIQCGIPKDKLSLVHAIRAKNFGQAVAAGLRGRDCEGVLWLLHSDCYPEPDCLAHLVAALDLAPSVGVVGPKQLRADDPTRLGEVGVTTTPLGRRVPYGHDGELDQGQFDALEDVLGVGSAGMAIRAEVWRALGGLAPALGPFRDGLEFCRRARLAGHRVVVEPAARLAHEQATYRGLAGGAQGRRPGRAGRAPAASTRRSFRARRRAWVFTLLADCSFPALLPLAAMALVVGLGRFAWRIAAKEFRLAVDELAAPLAVLTRPDALARARYVAGRTRRAPRRSLAPLLVSAREARAGRRDRRLTQAERRRQALSPTEIEAAELRALAAQRRRMAAAVAAVAAAVVGAALYRLVGPGAVVGGALGFQDLSPWDLARRAAGGWQQVGLGQPGPGDPFAAVLAVATLAALGDGALGVKALLIGAPLLAAAGAWGAAGAASRSVWVRAWAALAYLAAPPLWTALAQGRLGAAVAHAALPWALLGAARAIGANRLDVRPAVLGPAQGAWARAGGAARLKLAQPGSTAAAGAGGLAFALVAAGSPVLLGPGLAGIGALALVAGRGRRLRLVWLAAPALALFAPLIWSVANGGAWRQLLADPGPTLAYNPAPGWQRLLGWSEAPVWPEFVPAAWGQALAGAVAAGAVVAALIGLARLGRAGRAARFGWWLALLGAAAVVACGRVAASHSGLEPVYPWSGGPASLVLAGLLMAAAVGLTGLVGDPVAQLEAGAPAPAAPAAPARRGPGRGRRLAAAGVGLAALLAGPILGAAHAVWLRATQPEVHRSQAVAVPPIALEAASGARGVYTLSLALVEGPAAGRWAVVWDVVRGAGRQLADPLGLAGARDLAGLPGSPGAPDLAERAINQAAAGIVARSPGAAALDLAGSGIGYVQAAAADLELTAALDATPGLARASESDQRVVWQVVPEGLEIDGRQVDAAARLHVVDGAVATALPSGPGGRIATELPAGGGQRDIVLAERADPGWRATLDGVELAASGGQTWAQVFQTGAAGGHLVIWHQAERGLGAIQIAVLALAALVALPVRRAPGEREDAW
jgi:GT2 family glycosyltransferase